jgi:alpha-1,6-mannosyltransferase
LVVCANSQLSGRLLAGGIENCETVPMGVEAGVFSPKLRCTQIRAAALRSLGLDETAILLLGIGRFAAEKRWDMVLRAAAECSTRRDVGLLLVGSGTKRQQLEMLAERLPNVAVLPKLNDRDELARLLASVDALVHGCEAETFCLVAAEARASGIPLIVPHRGGAADQVVPAAGLVYRAPRERSLERAIDRFIDRGPELQRAAATRACQVRTMDEHFADLFARYTEITPAPAVFPAAGGAMLAPMAEMAVG